LKKRPLQRKSRFDYCATDSSFIIIK
jgi:hypothetical protein